MKKCNNCDFYSKKTHKNKHRKKIKQAYDRGYKKAESDMRKKAEKILEHFGI